METVGIVLNVGTESVDAFERGFAAAPEAPPVCCLRHDAFI